MILPKVYIVMPCYNGEKYLLQQLMSIYFQSYTNWYLIFINDWSNDNSESIINDWISHYNLNNKVLYIKKENWWVNSAIQRGLNEIKNICISNDNTLIAYCDSDDIWTMDKLEVQVKYMVKHPECDLSYHNLSKIDENWKLILSSRMNEFYPYRWELFLMTMQNYITSTEMMFKSKYIDYIISMPTWFWIYQDFWTALVFCINWLRIHYIDEILWYYRTWHSSLIKKASKVDIKRKNDSHMHYFYALKERFPEKDISYVLSYNEDRYINWYSYSLPRVYLLMLFKYPKIFRLWFKCWLWKFFKFWISK